jgi:endonuclease G
MASPNHKILLRISLLLLKLIIQKPWMLLFFLLFPIGWYGYEIFIARPALSFQGVPQAQHWLSPSTWSRTFRSEGFLVGYSDIRGNPLWVSYKINSVPNDAQHLKRPSRFSSDWRSFNSVRHQDYTHSGYDRGHMAPNYAISRLYGKQAQLETFVMTNITPQKPNLNRKLWQRLEAAEIKYFTRLANQVWVTTGTVFTGTRTYLKKASHVEIPNAFYKIYAIQLKNKSPKLLAFLMPQKVTGHEPLDKFVVSVDEIESLTGLDFFHELEDKLEHQLESDINHQPWKLTAIANLPSRY